MAGARVVVGVDGSVPAADALAWAAAIGEVEPVKVLDDAVAERLAAAAGDDLLVIGTHKTGFLRGRVLGSRSLRIAAAATGPVAIVPSGAFSARVGVVVGVQGRVDPAPAVLLAAEHARRAGEPLVIVHAVGPDAPVGAAAADGAEVDPSSIAAAAAVHLVAARFPTVEVRIRTSHRSAAEAFLDASRTARLLVVGATDADRRAAYAGSAVHDLVLNVNAPLILVPASAA